MAFINTLNTREVTDVYFVKTCTDTELSNWLYISMLVTIYNQIIVICSMFKDK